MSEGLATLGSILIETTTRGGASPEMIAERALKRIFTVAETAPAPIREQAQMFEDNIRRVLVHYMEEMVRADRRTLAYKFTETGHEALLPLLEI